MMRRSSDPRCPALAFACLLQAWSLTGCSTCTEGQSRCNGNATEVCSPGDTLRGWVLGQACSGLASVSTADPYCVVLPSWGATCVAAPDAVPECADAGNPGGCWNNAPSICREGYPVSIALSCAAPNPFCVAGTCAAAESAVAECADAASSVPNTLCWHNAPSYCVNDGYVVAGTPCSGICVETDAACAFCDDGTDGGSCPMAR